jgi:hypothetical protein
MGLDMYAYTAGRNGQYSDWWRDAELDEHKKQFVNPKLTKPVEIAYWRKHPNLHGWMEQLWRDRQYQTQPVDSTEAVNPEGDTFNNVELELTREDIDQLEQCILENRLPVTRGFFFGDDSGDYYREQDLRFVTEARTNLFLGLRVFYNSSW